MIKEWVKKFLSVEHYVSEKYKQGDIPSTSKIYKDTFDIAWPSAMESISISLIAAIDMMMVGTVSTSAIAAVGITTQPKMIIMGTLFAINIGTTVICSRRKGEKDQEGAKRCLKNSLVLSVILSFVLTLCGFVFAEELMLLAQADLEYLDLAVNYFRIIMIGSFFSLVGLTITSAQRGVGNTKISLQTNLTANIVNVIFNYLLINGIWIFPTLGVTGAAIATLIGNVVAFILAVMNITMKKGFLKLSAKEDWHLDKKTIKQIYNISSSAFVEQIFLRVGFFAYSALIAGLGTISFVTHQVIMNVMMISFSMGDGLSIASSSLVGQKLGAKRQDLAMIYSKVCQKLGFIIAIVFGGFIFCFRQDILRLFTSDIVVHQKGDILMQMVSIIVILQIVQVITVGSLRGAGDVKFVAKLSIVSIAVLRPGLTFIFAYALGFGLIGAWVAVFIDQAFRNVISRNRFHKEKWLEIKI